MSWRLPPRWSRWRPAVWPEPQGIGAAPQKRAKAAASRKRRTSPACAIRLRRSASRAVEVADRVAVLVEQLADLPVEPGDALVEVLDVAGEVADAAGCDLLDEAVAEADPLEPAQLALAGEVDDACLADRVDLIPVGAEPLDRLRAVADETAPLELEQREGPHELGLERGAELVCAARPGRPRSRRRGRSCRVRGGGVPDVCARPAR